MGEGTGLPVGQGAPWLLMEVTSMCCNGRRNMAARYKAAKGGQPCGAAMGDSTGLPVKLADDVRKCCSWRSPCGAAMGESIWLPVKLINLHESCL